MLYVSARRYQAPDSIVRVSICGLSGYSRAACVHCGALEKPWHNCHRFWRLFWFSAGGQREPFFDLFERGMSRAHVLLTGRFLAFLAGSICDG
uniref:Uncharacterized protein n=1 Tax=mine drainage metagenome TaxID=410659 RepID=E6PQ94_9ZZZZ